MPTNNKLEWYSSFLFFFLHVHSTITLVPTVFKVPKVARAVVHLGKQRHGADDITGGERRNLIIWNHNRHYREQGLNRVGLMNIEKEEGPPDLECLSYTHDRDYAMYKAFPNPNPKKAAITNLQSSWCPPSKACYDTMEPINYNYMPKDFLADD